MKAFPLNVGTIQKILLAARVEISLFSPENSSYVMSCHFMLCLSCHATPHHDMSPHIMSYHETCHAMQYHAMSCHSLCMTYICGKTISQLHNRPPHTNRAAIAVAFCYIWGCIVLYIDYIQAN